MSRESARLYSGDSLCAEERLERVVRLERPDRVPVSLFIYYYAPVHCGMKVSEFMGDHGAYFRAIKRVYEEIGPWDLFYSADSFSKLIYSYAAMMRPLWPGIDLPDDSIAQTEELRYMEAEDYGRILDSPSRMGDFRFRLRMISRFLPAAKGLGPRRLAIRMAKELLRMTRAWRSDFSWLEDRGAAILMGPTAEMPFDTFSQARTVIHFSMDILKKPETVRDAALRLTDNFVDMLLTSARMLRVPRVQLFCHRTSNSFISPTQFERYAFPSLERAVNRVVDAGMTPILHCDGDWLKNLKTLRRLPPKKVIIEFDGFTDIFKAKEEIGDHSCIYGDVPAEKLVNGSPQEVDEYCHRLIEEVGAGGGFILSGGCEVPYNAKAENLKALVDSARKYGYYGRDAALAENGGRL